jgi:hypothetical protein
MDGGTGFATAETQEFARSDITGMRTCLAEGRSLAFSLPVFDSWFKSSAMARWGLITLPLPGEPPRDGHALAIVSYQDDTETPGGGYFLVRNSWQPWAWDAVCQPGYGCIPYAYVSRFASTIFSARRRPDGRAFVRGEKLASPPELWVNSPDVWLRQAPGGGAQHQAPMAGRESYLYVRLHNPGPTYLYNVRAAVYYDATGAGDWRAAAEFEQTYLRPGGTVLTPSPWISPFSGTVALGVRLT